MSNDEWRKKAAGNNELAICRAAPSLSNPHIKASVIGQYLGFGFGFRFAGGFLRVGVTRLLKSHSTLDNS